MHLIQNESRYSIEFRKGHFYRILYLNQYVYLNIHGQYMYANHFLCWMSEHFDENIPSTLNDVYRRNRYFYLNWFKSENQLLRQIFQDQSMWFMEAVKVLLRSWNPLV